MQPEAPQPPEVAEAPVVMPAKGPIGLYPVDHNCPIPVLKPGSEEVAKLCGVPTTDFCCPACWKRATPATRRAFNAERNRLRKAKSLKITALMKQLIARVVVEAALRP